MIYRVKCSVCGSLSRSSSISDTCPGGEEVERCGASLRDAEVVETLKFNPNVNYSKLPFTEWQTFSQSKKAAIYGAALRADPRKPAESAE